MRRMMLKIFTEFRNIFFHKTTRNSTLTHQMLVWKLISALSFAVFHIWKKWFTIIGASKIEMIIKACSDASLQHIFYQSSHDRLR